MRSNIKINYSILKEITQKTYDYKAALEEIDETINNINVMLQENNSGESIDALKECYEDLKGNLESCYNEVSEIHKVFDEYITEMTSIIKPKNESIAMVVGRTDIYMNMKSIIGDCRTGAMIMSNAGTYRSLPNLFESDEEKENAKSNYNKVQEIWQIIRRYETLLNDDIDELNNLFNTKVVTYEDMDDTFKGRASQLYDEQSTLTEKIRTGLMFYAESKWNEGKGIFNSIKDGIIGLYELLTLKQKITFDIGGALLGYFCISVTGDAPDVLQDCMDTVDSNIETAKALLKDPMLLGESIAQGILDAYENEGLSYCTGYLEGEILQIFALDSLGKLGESGKVRYSWKSGYQGDLKFLGKGNVGDFSKLEGMTIEDVLSRIPKDATRRELTPQIGKVTEGFEYKWVQDGKTYRVRIHGIDESAPAGSNAANGWVVRVQKGKRYLDPVTMEYQPTGITNINSPNFNEELANRTHIPIQDPKE